MEKIRVYMDFDPSVAPEPIGAVHDRCRDELPVEDDGNEIIVDGVLAEPDEYCMVCE